MIFHRFVLGVAVFFVACNPYYDTTDESLPDDERLLYASIEERVEAWLDAMCSASFAGRKVGTDGNYLAFQYLMKEGREMGFSPEEQSFEHKGGIMIRNILIRIDGEEPDSLFIIGAHYDGQYESVGNKVFQAANDNASGVVTTLYILDSLSKINKPRYSMLVCFWDGEEGVVAPPFKGSDYFVSHFENKESIVLYVNIDAIGHNHDNSIFLGWYGGNSNLRISKMIESLREESQFNYLIKQRGPGDGSSDYRCFSQVQVPYISYTDITLNCDHPQHSVWDTKDYIDKKRLIKVGDLTIDILNSI